ncbi:MULTISPECIES: hypothetical protein [unclassified Rhodococcus (in: high G+C Gram-positive bacteria)]|uniref:hypothetical protein n=1 Tax=unclassified Rhodococcus (in: high G+C Gram-positive bacteria) TaxID=192944 RepID=UPI003399E29B
MAIRRSTWLQVRDSVSVHPDIHEIERALRIHWAWHVLLFAQHKPYDTERGRYSLRYILGQNRARGLPIDMNR